MTDTDYQQEGLPRIVHRYFEVSLFLLVTVGFLALATTGRLDIPSLALVSLALAAKAWRYRHQREPELSSGTVTVLTWFYFIFYLADMFVISRDFLLATAHMVLFIAVVRIYSARTNRDYVWLAIVAFLELLASATLTVDTTFILFFLFFLVLAISTFVSFEIKNSLEKRSAKQSAPGGEYAARLPRALTLTSWSVALAVLLISTFIFFLLPRVSAGYLSAYTFRYQRLSGFSSEVTLGEIGAIKQDPRVVMRIKAVDGDTADLVGLRWRGITLSHFDGHRWSSFTSRRGTLRTGFVGDFGLRFRPLEKLPSRTVRYRVLREPITTDTLFAAAVPARIRGRFQRLRYGADGALYLPGSTMSTMNYEVESRVAAPAVPILRAVPTRFLPEDLEPHLAFRVNLERALASYLQLPEVDSRVEDLAGQLMDGHDTVFDKAKALENHLRTQYGYTLDLPTTPEEDPIASFLFERQEGHCEYFASAMVIMLRTQGIPTRIVNGFLTGEYNSVSGNFIVRASDAHTWVEVLFPGIGWVEFDPTPPDPNAPERNLWTLMGHYYDAFDLWWDEWVINYDIWQQVQMARNVGGAMRAWTLSARRWMQKTRRSATESVNGALESIVESPYTAPGAIALALLLLAFFRGNSLLRWLREFRLLRNGKRAAFTASEATLVYQRLLRVLQRRGFRKQPAQTPLEFAAAIDRLELAGNVAEFTRLYNRSRFGATTADSSRLLELLRTVEAWTPA